MMARWRSSICLQKQGGNELESRGHPGLQPQAFKVMRECETGAVGAPSVM